LKPKDKKILVENAQINDIVIVKLGEKFPVDAAVTVGVGRGAERGILIKNS